MQACDVAKRERGPERYTVMQVSMQEEWAELDKEWVELDRRGWSLGRVRKPWRTAETQKVDRVIGTTGRLLPALEPDRFVQRSSIV